MQGKRLIGAVVLSAVAALALAGCSDRAEGGEAWMVATEAPAGAGGAADGSGDTPAASDTGDGGVLVQGLSAAEFFSQNCAVCHGANREGGVGLPLTPDRLTEEDAFYQDTIRNGRPGTAMAAMGTILSLSDEEIAALVTFLKTDEP